MLVDTRYLLFIAFTRVFALEELLLLAVLRLVFIADAKK